MSKMYMFSQLVVLAVWLSLQTSLVVGDNGSNGNGNLALSDVNVLLPLTTAENKQNAVRYKITAEGGASNGCVEWSVDDDSIVSILALSRQVVEDGLCSENEQFKKCPQGTSSALLITAASHVEKRVSTHIHARDPKSNEVAECNIFVDKVASLQIETSTRLIYLTKYESIKVNGFDRSHNRFSTIEGLTFLWKGIGTHLRGLSFANAQLQMPETFSELHKIPTNMQPVQGVLVGTENVTVQIDTNVERGHKGCEPAKASLSVVEHLKVDPPKLFMPPCAEAQTNLLRMSSDREGKDREERIELPQSDKYHFSVQPTGAVPTGMKIDQKGLLTAGKNEEQAQLIVTDTVNHANKADRIVHVVKPDRMTASVVSKENKIGPYPRQYRPQSKLGVSLRSSLEREKWHLTTNEAYSIHLGLEDSDHNELCVRPLSKYDDGSELRSLKERNRNRNQRKPMKMNDLAQRASYALNDMKLHSHKTYTMRPFEIPKDFDNENMYGAFDEYMNFYEFSLRSDAWFNKEYVCDNIEYKVTLCKATGCRAGVLPQEWAEMVRVNGELVQSDKTYGQEIELMLLPGDGVLENFVMKFVAMSCEGGVVLGEIMKLITPTPKVRFAMEPNVVCPRIRMGDSAIGQKRPFDYGQYLMYAYGSKEDVKKMEAEKSSKGGWWRGIYKNLSVVLPFTGFDDGRHTTVVTVEGGSGEYVYDIIDEDIAKVKEIDGKKVTVSAVNRHAGSTLFFVIDAHNPDNWDVIPIDVSLINHFMFSNLTIKELLLDSRHEFSIEIRSANNEYFSNFDSFSASLKMSLKHGNVEARLATSSNYTKWQQEQQNSSQPLPITAETCDAWEPVIRIHPTKLGYEKITSGVSYNDEHPVIKNNSYFEVARHRSADFVWFFVYRAMQLAQPRLVLARNTKVRMEWFQGLYQWSTNFSADPMPLTPLELSIRINTSADQFGRTSKVSDLEQLNPFFDFDFKVGENKSFLLECYKTFRYELIISVSNRQVADLQHPVTDTAVLELYCLPQLELLEVDALGKELAKFGVGTRHNATKFFPRWLRLDQLCPDPMAKVTEFLEHDPLRVEQCDEMIHILSGFDLVWRLLRAAEPSNQIVSLQRHAANLTYRSHQTDFIAKKLGQVEVEAKLVHADEKLYVYPKNFDDALKLTVSFEGFFIETASLFMREGASMIAHIEGIRGELPENHNFDDVMVEWRSSDTSIVGIVPVIAGMDSYFAGADAVVEGKGFGFSVRLVARRMGKCAIHAKVWLRDPPETIQKHEFELKLAINVIPIYWAPQDVLVMRPNSSINLKNQMLYQALVEREKMMAGVDASAGFFDVSHAMFQMYELFFQSDETKYVTLKDSEMTVHANVSDDVPVENVVVNVYLASQYGTDFPPRGTRTSRVRRGSLPPQAETVTPVAPDASNAPIVARGSQDDSIEKRNNAAGTADTTGVNAVNTANAVAAARRAEAQKDTSRQYRQHLIQQLGSYSVAIVDPTGVNIVPPVSVTPPTLEDLQLNEPTLKLALDTFNNRANYAKQHLASLYATSGTDNIVCEGSKIVFRLAIIDELVRHLAAMNKVQIVSNDSNVVAVEAIKLVEQRPPRTESKTKSYPVFADVELRAVSQGFAVIKAAELPLDANKKLLKTFLSLRVLSGRRCIETYGAAAYGEQSTVSSGVRSTGSVGAGNGRDVNFSGSSGSSGSGRGVDYTQKDRDRNDRDLGGAYYRRYYYDYNVWQAELVSLATMSDWSTVLFGGLLLLFLILFLSGANTCGLPEIWGCLRRCCRVFAGGFAGNGGNNGNDIFAPNSPNRFDPYGGRVGENLRRMQGMNPSPMRRRY